MSTLSDKLATKQFPYRDVIIGLDGPLGAKYEDARRALAKAKATAEAATEGKGDVRLVSGGVPAAQSLVDDLEAQLRAAAVTIRITGVSFGEYNSFVTQNPPRKGHQETFNPSTFFMFVARKTGQYVDDDGNVHPITPTEWDQIEASITDGDHDRIANAIVAVNRTDAGRGVDFLSSASVGTTVSSESSAQPEASESATAL